MIKHPTKWHGVAALAVFFATHMAIGDQPTTPSVVGIWKLIEYHDWRPDGSEEMRIGPDAEGMFIYSNDGRLSLHIVTGNERAKLSASTTDAERGAIFRPYIGYYGTYSVDYDTMTITHHIEGAKVPNRIGRSAIRPIRFEDGELILDFGSDNGWRFFRRLKRIEALK